MSSHHSIVIAFANLFGMGGAPLCSIERGRGNDKEAEKIMGNSFVLLVAFGLGLTVLGLILKKSPCCICSVPAILLIRMRINTSAFTCLAMFSL